MSDFQSNQAFTPSNTHTYPGKPFLRYALLPPRAMAGEEICTLWFVIDGDFTPFQITVHVDVNINNLKEDIGVEKKIFLCDVNTSSYSLVLWKVRIFYRPA